MYVWGYRYMFECLLLYTFMLICAQILIFKVYVNKWKYKFSKLLRETRVFGPILK